MNLWLQDAYSFKITKRLNNNCEKLCKNGFIGQFVVPQSKGSSIDISRIDRMDNLQRTNLERDEITKCQSWTKIFFSALKMNISFVYFAYLIEWRQKVDRIFPLCWNLLNQYFFAFFPSLKMYLMNQQHLHLCHTLAGLTFTFGWFVWLHK